MATESPWKTRASNKDGGNFEAPPPGTHPAVCVGIIDLGTQEDTYQGETKRQKKLYLCWELVHRKKMDGDNFIVALECTWSLGKKAKLRGLIEGWLGRQFHDDEEFELPGLLGKPCLITMVDHNGYPRINQVGAPIDGMDVPGALTTPLLYHTSDSTTTDQEPPIPEWVPYTYGVPIKEKIMASPEWENRSPF